MKKKIFIALLGVVVLGAASLLPAQLDVTYRFYYALMELMPFSWPGASTIRLKKYAVALEKMEINGIDKDLSGITFNWDTDSLFAVIDESPVIFELSRQGVLLRKIKLKGFEDLEGICYLGKGKIAVVEERRRCIVFIAIDPSTDTIEKKNQKIISPMPGEYDNRGFEGIACDIENGNIYVAKERRPRKIIKISGIKFEPLELNRIEISNLWDTEPTGLKMRDFSGLHFDTATGHLLILSDESRVLAEITPRGVKVGILNLGKGDAGLSAGIPKPEGVTMDRNGTIFIASEPNLLYTFKARP